MPISLSEPDVLRLDASAVSAIIAYVRAVNRAQGDYLARTALNAPNPAVRELAARLKTTITDRGIDVLDFGAVNAPPRPP
jgi:hypothetical protein